MDKGIRNYQLFEQFADEQKMIFYLFDLQKQMLDTVIGNPKEIIGVDPLADGHDMQSFASLLYHPDDQQLLKIKTEFFKNKKGGTWAGIFRIKHANGHWVWVYYRHFTFGGNDGGSPTHIGGISFDLSDGLQTQPQMKDLLSEPRKKENHEKTKSLTKREIEIIRLIAKGYEHKAIAVSLNISQHTVDTHRKNILRKLDLHSIGALSCFAAEMGLV